MYRDNTEWCERVFAGIWRRLSVQEYMLAGKARDDFRLLEKGTDDPTCTFTRGDCVDKRVVFTVEGLRKTSLLRDSLREDYRALLLTHTRNNALHLSARVIPRFGLITDGIRV